MDVRKPTTPEPGAFERGHLAAPVAVALEVDVAAPPERVWNLLCRVERWAAWHPGIDVAILRGDAPAPGVKLDWRADGMRIRSVVLEAREPGGGTSPGRLEWTLRMMGATGAQRWSLLPLPDGGTSVRIEEWWTGITPRLLRRTLQRTLDVARAAWLERLRHRAERPPTTPGDSGKDTVAP
ncbi:MAG: hypothetical protein EA350_07450 [Gemmatimonadales bacterium]|nr:MAG: hypothetical protein EA350_07450 [Gemmatimonadales bacterium]